MTKHKKVEWLIRIQELRDLLADQRIRPNDWVSIDTRYKLRVKRWVDGSSRLVATLNLHTGELNWIIDKNEGSAPQPDQEPQL